MSKTIVMHDTACGPKGNFYAGQKYQVGVHIDKEQAAAFVAGRHASYETAVAAKAPENTSNNPGGDDQVSRILAGDEAAVKAGISALTVEQLKAAQKAEASGQKRKEVFEAIKAAIKAKG